MLNRPWSSTNAASHALNSRAGNSCLPAALVQSVPSCAILCIQNFVQQNYQNSDCTATSSLTNLCTEKNTSGLTIGEGSVQCILSACSGNDLLAVGVYNICAAIRGALPNTATIISATRSSSATASVVTITSTAMASSAPAATDPAGLPQSIGQPDTTQQVTSLVMPTSTASGSSSAVATTTSQQDSTASNSASPVKSTSSTSAQSTMNAVPAVDRPVASTGLQLPQIVGLALGISVTVLITLAFFFFWCRHRKDAGKNRSKRRSGYTQQTPPPKYDGPSTDNGLLVLPTRNSHYPSVNDPNLRYYAGVPEDKRRSFWRRSIRPEEIGVAVSPKINQSASPTSVMSHQSVANLLPKGSGRISGQSLWVTPVDLEADHPENRTDRPVSDATTFDEDIEAQNSFSLAPAPRRPTFALAVPSKARLSHTQGVPVQVGANIDSPRGGSHSKKSDTRLPLTPTYDNGHFSMTMSRPPPSSWRRGPQQSPPDTGRSFLLSDNDSTRSNGARHFLRKKPSAKSGPSPEPKLSPPLSIAKPEPTRMDSETTAATDIETVSTPEEIEKLLEAYSDPAPPRPNPSISLLSSPRSPISDLRYPNIPRSAAISRQAEQLPVAIPPPLPAGFLTAPPTRLSRTTLVRNESSFMITDTTSSIRSSDGYMSDASINWPQPPTKTATGKSAFAAVQANSAAAFKNDMQRLRNRPHGESNNPFRQDPSSFQQRGAFRPRQGTTLNSSLNYAMKLPTTELKQNLQPVPLMSVRAPSRQVIIKEGDLYFKVEM